MIGTGNVALFNQDAQGNPLYFYLTRMESREQLGILIKERGGEVLDKAVPPHADQRFICVVSDAIPDLAPLTLPDNVIVVTRQFILDCIERNELQAFNDYAPKMAVHLVPSSAPGRNAFTPEEDKSLLEAVSDASNQGYKEDGMILYARIASLFPRHTAQSLYDRYLEHLLSHKVCRLVASSPLRGRIVDHRMGLLSDPVCMIASSQELIGTNPHSSLKASPMESVPSDPSEAPVLSTNPSGATLHSPNETSIVNPANYDLIVDVSTNETNHSSTAETATPFPSIQHDGPVQAPTVDRAVEALPMDIEDTQNVQKKAVECDSSLPSYQPFTQAFQLPDTMDQPLTLPSMSSILTLTSNEKADNHGSIDERAIRETVKWLTEQTGRPFSVVLFALYQCDGGVESALSFLHKDCKLPLNWHCQEDLDLLRGDDRARTNKIVRKHGLETVRKRRDFLKNVCQ